MSFSFEYDVSVRHSLLVSVALLSVALPLGFISSAHAQTNGPPTAAISPPLVGRSVNPPTSVTSLGPGLGPNAHAPGFRAPLAPSNEPHDDGNRHPHHHHDAVYGAPWAYAVPVPYAVDAGATDPENDVDDSADDAYQGGPTVFDRRGSGAASYIPPVRDVPTPHSHNSSDNTSSDNITDASVSDSGPAPQPTLLVFKDGRKLEVGNYAILGQTLFDLTPGHARKIALADLDLDATREQNEDRGLTFQLPSSPQAN